MDGRWQKAEGRRQKAKGSILFHGGVWKIGRIFLQLVWVWARCFALIIEFQSYYYHVFPFFFFFFSFFFNYYYIFKMGGGGGGL
jgi:hypothetical protein